MLIAILWNMAVLSASGFTGFRFFVVFKFALERAWLANFYHNDRKFFEHSPFALYIWLRPR
jgi:hypothetical protein